MLFPDPVIPVTITRRPTVLDALPIKASVPRWTGGEQTHCVPWTRNIDARSPGRRGSPERPCQTRQTVCGCCYRVLTRCRLCSSRAAAAKTRPLVYPPAQFVIDALAAHVATFGLGHKVYSSPARSDPRRNVVRRCWSARHCERRWLSPTSAFLCLVAHSRWRVSKDCPSSTWPHLGSDDPRRLCRLSPEDEDKRRTAVDNVLGQSSRGADVGLPKAAEQTPGQTLCDGESACRRGNGTHEILKQAVRVKIPFYLAFHCPPVTARHGPNPLSRGLASRWVTS